MSKPNFTSNNDSLPSIPKSKPLPQDSQIHKNTSTTDADFMLEENSELEGINDFLHENKHSHFNESLFEQELNKSGKLQVAHLLNIIDGSGDRPRSKPPIKAEKAPEASNFSRAKSPITVTEHIPQNVDSLSSHYSSVKVDDESIPKTNRVKQATPIKTEQKQQVSKVKICPARIPSNIKDQAFTSTNIEKSKKNPEKLSQDKSPLKTKKYQTPVATIEENKNTGYKNTASSSIPSSSRLKQRTDNKSPERILQLKSAGEPSEEGTKKSPQMNPQNDRINDTPTTFTEKKQENKNYESVKSTTLKEEIHTEPAAADKELEKIEMLNEILAKREVQLELDDENLLIRVPTQTDFSPASRLSGSRTTRSPSKEISKYVSKLKKSGILPRDSLPNAKRTTSPGRNSDVKGITTPAKTLSGYEQPAAGGLKIETPRRTIPDQRLQSPRKPIRQNVVEPAEFKSPASMETTSSVKDTKKTTGNEKLGSCDKTPTKTIPTKVSTESKKLNEKGSHKSSFSRDTPSSLQEEIKTETSPSSSAAGQKTSELLQEVLKIIKGLDTHYLVDLKTFLETNSVLLLKDINSRIQDGTLDLQKKREQELQTRIRELQQSQPTQQLFSNVAENEKKKKIENSQPVNIKISFDDFGDLFEAPPSATPHKENIEKKIETHYMMTGNLNRVKDIETTLSSFSYLNVNQLKEKILHLNSDILTSKTCSQLLTICPNQEEINLFKTYKGPISELNKVNQCLFSMSGIPRLSSRLEMTIFKMNFQQEFEKELKDMTQIRKMLEFLHENKNLQNFVQIISNFKKEKFSGGDAKCQSIINFTKISSKKSKDSLLTYLLKKIAQQDSHLLDFANIDHDLEQAFDVRFELSIWNIEKMKSKFNQLELELELSEKSNPPDSPFIESFQEFSRTSSQLISGAIQLGKTIKSLYFQVVQLLGEELETISSATITDFLSIIKQILTHIKDFKALPQ